jgi:hypothetical protein
MPSDADIEAARLADSERIIRALEALVAECESRGLDRLRVRINDCVSKCQNDYLAEQRRLYNRARSKPKAPPSTQH